MTLQVTDQTSSLPRRKIVTVFLACASVDLAAIIDQNTLAVALPRVGSILGASSQASWIPVAYFITATSFQPLYGPLSNIWSRKLVLLAGIAIFFIGSLGASLASNVTHLIIFRAITGIGGGGLITIAQIIVGDVVSLRERGKWQGILGAAVAISNGLGPIIGGKIASYSNSSWRWIFRLNLFNSAISALMVLFFMPLKKVEGHWKIKLKLIDFFGCALTLIASTLVILGLSWGGNVYPWLSLHVILALTLSGVFTVAFLLWQWKGAQLPLLPLVIFKSRMVQGATITTFSAGWNYYVQVYFIPTYYQLAYGYTPVKAAAMLLTMTMVQTISSTASGLVVTWRGRYRESLIFGYVVWTIGIGLHSSLTPSSSLAMQLGYAILTGFGAGQTFQPGLIAMQAGVGREHMAVITGVRSFIRDLGGTFGLAVSGSMINSMVRSILSEATRSGQAIISTPIVEEILKDPTSIMSEEAINIRELVLSAYFRAFRHVFYLSTALSLSCVIAAIFLIPQIDLSVEEAQRAEEAQGAEEEEKKSRNELNDETVSTNLTNEAV